MMNRMIPIPDVGIFHEIRAAGNNCCRTHGMPEINLNRIIPIEWVPRSWIGDIRR